MRMRKKQNLPARMERCAAMLIADPAATRGRWRELFPQARELWLEIGCGKGRFSAEMAEQNPDVLYIALERVPDAMVMAMERAREMDICNMDRKSPSSCSRIYRRSRGEVNHLLLLSFPRRSALNSGTVEALSEKK